MLSPPPKFFRNKEKTAAIHLAGSLGRSVRSHTFVTVCHPLYCSAFLVLAFQVSSDDAALTKWVEIKANSDDKPDTTKAVENQ